LLNGLAFSHLWKFELIYLYKLSLCDQCHKKIRKIFRRSKKSWVVLTMINIFFKFLKRKNFFTSAENSLLKTTALFYRICVTPNTSANVVPRLQTKLARKTQRMYIWRKFRNKCARSLKKNVPNLLKKKMWPDLLKSLKKYFKLILMW